jgi:hypothetical protein
MPSRADRRLPWERLARSAALALLAVALWRLIAALGAGPVARVHVQLDGAPTARTRDSLAALARSGQAISWSGTVAAVAVTSEPVREPSAGTRVSVVADRGTAIGDSLGALDSLGAGGGSLTATGIRGAIAVRDGGTDARTLPSAAAALGRVLVLGRVGWEAKFVIAALEEDGWRVDARLRLSDTMQVTQGAAREPGVATHAAVVVLDSAVDVPVAVLTRYVRAGGGLVLAGGGAATRALATAAPARVIRTLAPEPDAFERGEPTRALPLLELGALRRDAVVLGERDGVPTIVARRAGGGRVVQSGLTETWRWRMQGEGSSVAAHRAFWSRLVGMAATAGPVQVQPMTGFDAEDASPLAALVQALGPARTDAPSSVPRPAGLPLWIGGLILVLLVAEWASRRLRGAA